MIEDEAMLSYYTQTMLAIVRDALRECNEYDELIDSPFIVDNVSALYRVFKHNYKLIEEDKWNVFRTR